MVAQGDQKRATHACNHHFFGVVLRNHGNRIRAVEVFGSGFHRFKQITAVLGIFVFDAVGDYFGIGLRFEFVAQALQAGTFFFKVFDDAVVYHGNQAA